MIDITSERQKEIIDNFMHKLPSIRPNVKEEVSVDLALDLYEKSVATEGFKATETYARILAKQGKNEKAINIYEQLILKYPQKSSYFANLIENLRNE